MSLAEASLWAVIKKQYIFKIKSYSNLYVSMVAVQLIAFLFTAGGMAGTSGIGYNNIYIEVKMCSGTGVFIFTVLWIMANSFILTLPLCRNIDFSFVTNRISSNMANIGFMATAAIAGGITTALATILLRNVFYYTTESKFLFAANFWVEPGELLTGAGVAIMYLLLFSAAGYLAGALMQLHRSLYVILPALLLGMFFYESANEHIRIFKALDFFFLEKSPLLFTFKIAVAVLLLWVCAMGLSNRTEVR
jgi:hypothetical protein